MQASPSNSVTNREFIKTTPEYLTRAGVHPGRLDGTFGVLLLHGFTSALDAVSGLIPTLEAMKLPYAMPTLRGHNATPDALIGVRAQDWYDDAYKALEELCQKVDHVIVIGLSMGGLVALNLCIQKHPCSDKIAACITWAPALGFVNPLAWLAKPLSLFFKNWKGQDSFHDPECRKNNHNYKTFPTKAFCELYDYAAETNKHLGEMLKPLCIIH
ncbi:MAG: alpha/beta fold hydrolase [Proteobacteria bacterium]|nr:alpha/beta fold hydrolase [Pseudomonadota bacterium]